MTTDPITRLNAWLTCGRLWFGAVIALAGGIVWAWLG